MRLLVWILGVMVTLAGLMEARAVAAQWVWAWWLFLGLWLVVGLVVMIAALVRVAASGSGRAALRAPAPQSSGPTKAQGGDHAG
jgi:hypothetical protein